MHPKQPDLHLYLSAYDYQAKMEVFRSYLNDLPVEILRFITVSLARKELKALRKMNRKLHSIASETLFESIALTTNDASYVQLLHVAASDPWRAQVRHLDWVLTYGIEPDLYTVQELSFREPWTSTLRKWGIRANRGQIYHGLDLQCELARRLPNVQTIRFWGAVASQRSGWEPWDHYNLRIEDVIKSTTVTVMTPSPNVSPDDVFSILQYSRVTPRLVKTVVARLHLDYSESKELTSVQIRHHEWEVRNRPGSLTIYRGAFNQQEPFSHDMNCFRSLALTGKVSKLRTLRLSGIWILLEEMATLLDGSPKLLDLNIGDVELSDSEEEEPMVNFLWLLRRHYAKGRFHKLKVTFQESRCRQFFGRFSATQQQVQAWMRGKDEELLMIASSAFTDGSESSSNAEFKFRDSDNEDMEDYSDENCEGDDGQADIERLDETELISG